MAKSAAALAILLAAGSALAAPPDGTPPTSIAAMAEAMGVDTLGDTYWAALDAGQESAKPRSSAGALGVVRVNPDASLTYRLVAWGMEGTMAHIHTGQFGQDGDVLFGLSGGPRVWTGTTRPADADTLAQLARGDLYFNIHSTDHPKGEIRGQVLPAPGLFGGVLSGEQEVPPTGSSASGYAVLQLEDDSLDYMVEISGMSGTMAHVHYGSEGTNGQPAFTLAGSGRRWQGSSDALSREDKESLFTCGLYVNVHSTAHRGGELRGQVQALPVLFQGEAEIGSTTTATIVLLPNGGLAWRLDGDLVPEMAHIHAGSGGPVVAALKPTRGEWLGILDNFDHGSLRTLLEGGLAIGVHNGDGTGFGSLEPALRPFGDGCASPEMFADGPPERDPPPYMGGSPY